MITHPGIIDEISPDLLHVRILNVSACSSCHAKGYCSMSEMEEKIVEVPCANSSDYTPGQQVNVVMDTGSGKRAVMLGYFIPLLILLFALIILTSITSNQGLAGIAAILCLVPWYLALYLFRNRIRRKMVFRIEHSTLNAEL